MERDCVPVGLEKTRKAEPLDQCISLGLLRNQGRRASKPGCWTGHPSRNSESHSLLSLPCWHFKKHFSAIISHGKLSLKFKPSPLSSYTD